MDAPQQAGIVEATMSEEARDNLLLAMAAALLALMARDLDPNEVTQDNLAVALSQALGEPVEIGYAS
jgi:hypothetical protein